MVAESGAGGATEMSRIDRLVVALQRRRAEAGNPSYAEIASRVVRARIEAGTPEYEARLSRSTVYDLFRLGRRRIAVDLLLEVVTALGADPAERAQWQERATQALAPVVAGGSVATEPRVESEPEARQPASISGPGQGTPEQGTEVELFRLGGSGSRLKPLTGRVALLVAVACTLLNVSGMLLTKTIPFELFLDMIGTAITALLIGPWTAVGVGFATNLGEAYLSHTWHGALFGVANAAGGLIWGCGVRRGLGATILRYVALNVIVAVAVSLISTVIIWSAYDGYTGHGSDSLVHTMVDRGHGLLMSIFSTNMITSLQDKLLAGFIALIVAEWVALRQGAESTRLPLGE